MNRIITACFLLFLAAAGLSAQPDTFYVDTTGIDAAGRGTLALPARTIRYTIDSLIDDNLADPCVIRVRPGSYLETAPFRVDSIGTDSVNTLTVEAFDPADPPELRTDDTTQSKMVRINVAYTTFDHVWFATSSIMDAGGYRGTMGIYQPYVTIRNCAFYKNPDVGNRTTFRRAISFGQNYTKIQNCLFYGSYNQSIVLELSGAFTGIEITNNVFIERPSYRPSGTWNGSQVGIAFWSGASGSTLRNSKIWNNVFYGLPAGAFDWVAGSNLQVDNDLIWYNMFWGNTLIVDNAAGQDILVDTVQYNFKEHPLLVDTCLEGSATGTPADLDLHLYRNSPAIDRGNPRVKDPDGGRADIGIYGGSEADTLAPHQLDTLTVLCNTVSQRDTLIWEYASPPSDFDQYAVYRDASGPGFIPGPGNIFDSITTQATTQAIYDNGGTQYWYKVNVWDDDTLGGGYKMFDTIPPYIGTDSIFYYSNGTVDPTDDTVVILLNEPVIDPFVFSVPADSYFVLYGMGDLSTCSLSTGSYPNDDTVVIYGFSDASHILCRERSWLGFKDASVWTDYVYNEGEQGDSVKVVTWNVANARTGTTYRTIGPAVTAAQEGDSLLIIDAGLYEENVVLDTGLSLFGYGYRNGGWITGDSMPVVQAPGIGGNLLNVQDDSEVKGIKFVVPASVGAVGQMVQQSSYGPHSYSRCVFDGSYNTSNWDSYSTTPYHFLAFTVDSCDFSGFNDWVVYSRSRERIQTVKNSRIHNTGGGGFLYYPAGNHNVPQYFTNNVFENVTGNSCILFRQCRYVNIVGNLFRNCRGAVSWTYYDNPNLQNYVAFNTVVNCSTNGISVNTDTLYADTVKYNIVWNSGIYDFNGSYSRRPVADYNWFTGGKNNGWWPGAHSRSGYPMFADTGTGDFRLAPNSLCLDFSAFTDADAAAKGLTAYDLDGTPRSSPSGSYWDLGAYEGMLGPPRVDSVKSWCCGTAATGDDSLVVYFRRPVEDDSLDTGAGNAGNTFRVLGLGSVGSGTVSSGSGVDDNQVVIRMANADTILSHYRSMLELVGGSVYDTFDVGSVPAAADTDSVTTFNVCNLRTDSAYATVELALLASVDNDTLMAFDRGYYTDTLNFERLGTARNGVSAVVLGADGMYPTIKNDGAGQTGHPSWQGLDMMIYNDNEDVEFSGFRFDGVNFAGDDTNGVFMWSDRGTVRNCSLYYARCKFDDGAAATFDGNIVYGTGLDWWTEDGGSISDNQFQDCGNISADNVIYLYGGENTALSGNRIFNSTTSIVVHLRNAWDNIIRNNVICSNTGDACRSSNEMSARNAYLNNTIINNANGLEVDSASAVRNNILYNNTGYDISLRASAATHTDSITYNYYDTTGSGMGDSLAGEGNMIATAYPLFGDSAGGDFHLRIHSPCIDRGDTAAAWNDYDAGRCDVGAYGGPYAIDTLQPHVPDAPLTVAGNKEAGYTHDTLSWSPYAYSRGDFALYAVYRDTFTDFVPVQGNCIDSIADSSTVTAAYANNGRDYVYKVSVANDTMYGSGYITGTYARIYQLKTSNRTSTVPGDTITYTLYYDNDGETASSAVFSIVDYLPSRAVYVDTVSPGLHSGGTVDVDWYNGATWQETEPAAGTVRAVRWEIQPGIGAQSGAGDASGADLTKSGVDTTQGTDSGWVRFRVVIQ